MPCCLLSGRGYGTRAAWLEKLSPDWSPVTPGAFQRGPGPWVLRSSVPFKQALEAKKAGGIWEGKEKEGTWEEGKGFFRALWDNNIRGHFSYDLTT